MLGKSLLIFATVALAAVPGTAEARGDAVAGSSQPRADLNTHSNDYGYHPGRRSFYSYPRHRHIDGGSEVGGTYGRSLFRSYAGRSKHDGNDEPSDYDRYYGSAYYGPNYGAPYFGSGYYDGGIYYRNRRD